MAGKPSRVNPVDMKFSPGPCVLVLLVSEWMKQKSSTRAPRWGSRSDVILPHATRGVVRRPRPVRVRGVDRRPDRPALLAGAELALLVQQARQRNGPEPAPRVAQEVAPIEQ